MGSPERTLHSLKIRPHTDCSRSWWKAGRMSTACYPPVPASPFLLHPLLWGLTIQMKYSLPSHQYHPWLAPNSSAHPKGWLRIFLSVQVLPPSWTPSRYTGIRVPSDPSSALFQQLLPAPILGSCTQRQPISLPIIEAWLDLPMINFRILFFDL